MASPKVSIVMPVHNMQRYLPQAVESILGQTFTDYELICVDDGSTDSSLEILQRYARADRRITVIRQANLGGTKARETGLRQAQAEYLLFVDADDIVPGEALQVMHAALEESGADIVFGDYAKIDASGRIFEVVSYPVNSGQIVPFKRLLELGTPQLWNKLFRRSLFAAVDFIPVRIGQDLALTMQAAVSARSILYLAIAVYQYRIYPGTITKSYDTETLLDIVRSLEIAIDKARRHGAYDCHAAAWRHVRLSHCLLQLKKAKYLPIWKARGLQKGILAYLGANLEVPLKAGLSDLDDQVLFHSSARALAAPRYWRHNLAFFWKKFAASSKRSLLR